MICNVRQSQADTVGPSKQAFKILVPIKNYGLNYKVYKWAVAMKTRTKNWYLRFQKHLRTINCSHFLDHDYGTGHIISTCEKQYWDIYIDEWKNDFIR